MFYRLFSRSSLLLARSGSGVRYNHTQVSGRLLRRIDERLLPYQAFFVRYPSSQEAPSSSSLSFTKSDNDLSGRESLKDLQPADSNHAASSQELHSEEPVNKPKSP